MNIKMNTENSEAAARSAAEVLSSSAIARRRVLLKGVGKGTAVLAAAAPLQTLAGQSLLTCDGQYPCSVSGMQSGVHSATPTNTLISGGYSPGWWGQSDKSGLPKNWPPSVNSSAYCETVFKQCVLKNSDGSTPTLFQIMDPKDKTGKFSSSDEFHWVCAWLNAKTNSFNFPYSDAEVVAFYDEGSPSKTYIDALYFFKKYMETHIS